MASTSMLSADSMLQLEQSFLRVPVEGMRRVHKSSKVEKEMAAVQAALSTKGKSKEDTLKMLDAAINKMQGVKRKLIDADSSQRSLVSTSSSRIGHLQSLESVSAVGGIGDSRYRGWANTRLDRHILDYLLRRGYAETAKKMVEGGDTPLSALSDVEVGLFTELDTITAALQKGTATQALAWCKDNSAALKKGKSTLEFDLRFQEFIQLARQAKRHEAIAYCRKHLVPSATATASGSARIRSAMALLAFGPDTTCPPYRAMYDISRWNILADTFRRAFLSFYALPPLPLLNLSIWAGLAGLKLPACASSSDKEHNTDCPTCVTSGLGHFATLAHQPQVPMGHHVNSVIVCKITGKVLAGEDTAYALPNGNVYSGEALEELAKKGNGSIHDPRSDTTYEWRDLKKVYIT